jgi:acyl-CoA thioesterase-1
MTLALAAVLLAAACKHSSADDSGVPPTGNGASGVGSIAKSSTPVGRDSAHGDGRQVLFIGTSLTAGLGLSPDSAYPQLIQQKIDSAKLPFVVENAGLSGETTAGLLRRLDWLMRGSFEVVLVESGANDGLRGTPVETVKENLRAILSRIRTQHPSTRVLLVQMEAPPNLGPEYTNAFHALYGAVAKQSGASLVPFLLQGVAGNRDLNQADGIHPNQRGEHIVADNVWKSLDPVLRQLATGL